LKARVEVLDVNVRGVLYTAQAAGGQMERLGIPGSIVLTAAMNGSVEEDILPRYRRSHEKHTGTVPTYTGGDRVRVLFLSIH
ncbi:hypothetical protein B0H19DRAFT_1203144, partial [Mycena capillaripes]